LEASIRGQERAAAARLRHSLIHPFAAPEVETDALARRYLLAPLGPDWGGGGAGSGSSCGSGGGGGGGGAIGQGSSASESSGGGSGNVWEGAGAAPSGGARPGEQMGEGGTAAGALGLRLTVQLVQVVLERHPDAEVREQVRRH
jgi:hypothetical protein